MIKPGVSGICCEGQGLGSAFFFQRSIAERSLGALFQVYWLLCFNLKKGELTLTLPKAADNAPMLCATR